jgi:flavin-dependent dehydrogenase
MYDAIVVGARCAGSPTAMLLARRGRRVLLLDKSTFPSDIMSTHYIHLPGVERLRRWGLLDRVLATNCPRITNVTLHMNGSAFNPPALTEASGPQPFTVCPRRTVLDKILVDAAAESGAELREGVAVQDLLMDGGRVTGVRARTKDGATFTEDARIVIGADGLHSTVAGAVKPPEYNTKPSLTYGYYAYWSGVPTEGAELYFLESGGVLVFPTNDSLTCVAVGGLHEGFPEFRKDIEANYLRVIDTVPELSARIRAGTRETRFAGTADQPNYFRRPYGPGWALVGDAGYHRDFVTGLGITDAFRDAELLSDAVDDAFAGRRPLDDALAAYERRRNEIAEPLYELTCNLATGTNVEPAQFLAFGVAMQAMMPAAAEA